MYNPEECLLRSLLSLSGKSEVHPSVAAAIVKLVNCAQTSEDAAPRLLTFAKQMAEAHLLKIMSVNIPDGILPEGYQGDLHDIKVNGHGPDDEIYSNYPAIRQKIPRGATLMDLRRGDVTSLDSVIYGNRKFTGNIGDEDDVQPESNGLWQKYFLTDHEKAHRVVCMQKINGEAAHFSGRYIGKDFYIITGSKNVHMVIKERSDIDKYDGDRYSVAKVVARCVWDTLFALKKSQRSFLWDFLHHTKCTAVCEILQKEAQHIVNLSHLDKPLLNVISFTQAVSDEPANSLVAMPPHHTLDLLSYLGFTCPSYMVIPAEDIPRHRDEIRCRLHEEGEVLYFLNENEETIGLVKAKTVWYIMLRALREKVVYAFHTRRQAGRSIQEKVDSVNTRFMEIQEWLQFSDPYIVHWKNLAKDFLTWMDTEIKEERIASVEIRPRYPVLWERFLTEKHQSDSVTP